MKDKFTICKKLFWLVSLGFCLIGCKGDPQSSLIQISVPQKIDDEIYLIDIAKSIERIQLETVEGAMLRYVSEIKVLDGNFFISDGNKICVFDSTGQFVRRFGKSGEGPGEYKYASSLAIDSEKGLVYVASGRKIMVYSKDSKFLKEKSFPMFVNYVEIVRQQPFILTEEIGIKVKGGFANQTNVVELDSDLNVLDTIQFRTIVLNQTEIGGQPFKHFFSDNGEGIYFYKSVLTSENMIRDTLYRFEDRKFLPYLKLKFEKRQSMKENPLNEIGYQTLLLNNIIYSASYLITEYSIDWEKMMFFYDKRTSKGYNLKGGVLDEDGEPLMLRPLDLATDTFYFVKSVEYQGVAIEEVNPVIGIVRLK